MHIRPYSDTASAARQAPVKGKGSPEVAALFRLLARRGGGRAQARAGPGAGGRFSIDIDRSKAARLLAPREGRREREGRARRAKCRHVLLQLQHRVHVLAALASASQLLADATRR